MRGRAITGNQVKQFVAGSYEDKKGTTKDIDGYKLDESLSSRKAKVYVNPEGKAVVANRGTKGTMADWANNAAYLAGKYKKTDRFKHAKKLQKAVNAKYGAENVTNVGHSQSGQTIRALNKQGLVNKAVVVNPASKGEKVLKNEEVIRSNRDLVSAFTPDSKRTTTIRASSYNPLTEHSADIITGKHANRSYGGRLNACGTNVSMYVCRHS
jgi:ribosomal protein L34E